MRSRLFLLLLTCLTASAAKSPDQTVRLPNIVLIFIDDLGYGDIGAFGNTVNQTPHLDRMAKEGNVLRQFYVANTACTPSRAALMTGTYAHRIGMDGTVCFPGENRGLNPDETTMAEMLKAQGYATGCFGKWHLGDQPAFLPLAQGFDQYFGIPYSNDMWPGNKRGNPITNRGPYEPLPVILQNEVIAHVADGEDQALLAEAITDHAVDFITANKDKPFFCYVPHAYVHNPRFARPEILAKAEGNVNRANVEEVDTSVGRILDTLRAHKIAENTLVLFMSDNGGAGGMSMGPLRGGKGGPKYEGHMRTPTIAWWPNTIAAGSETTGIGVTTDLLPSFAKLVGATLPKRQLDGKDVLDLLLGKPGAKSPHAIHYYETTGIRRGPWKLVRGRKSAELYNLDNDLGERKNLAKEKPAILAELNALLDAHAKSIAANTRPAGFVPKESAKPLLTSPGTLPKLSHLNSNPRSGTSSASPDVLFIAIDDMNDWTTLFDDSNPIQTPNLKRLAARGAFFNKAYCVVPACNPSRTAILTGLSPTTSGVYSNGNRWKDLLPDAVTLPQHFGQNGYSTKGGGKIFHHGGTGADRADKPSFQDFFKLRLHANKPPKNYNGYTRDIQRNLASPSWDWGVHDVDKQTDEYTLDYVGKILQDEPRDKPLFLAAGIFRPHLPFWAPPATFSRYPFDKVKLPPRPAGDLDDVPPTGVRMSRKEPFIFDHSIKSPEDRPGSLRKMVQCYQAASDYADEMVGRLIDQFDASGRADNTIIVLWSDHGSHLGDKNATVKFTLWEKANHVPFIIVAPGVTKPGTVIDRPVSLLDIYPTLIELAGLPPMSGLDGASLVPLLKNPKAKWDRPAIMTQGKGNHAVRSDRYRYIRYADGTEELYDHDKDPWEHTNLAKNAEFAAVIAAHKKHLPEKVAESATDARGETFIANFESGVATWTPTGTAFDPGPRPNRVTGYLGSGLINSYLRGDKATGTLTSLPFTIERPHIKFLIGGGNHPGKTGMQLLLNDKVVRSATGNSRKNAKKEEYLEWKSWDVSEFRGQMVRLCIIDQHSGGWGHILVDHIVQAERGVSSAAAPAKSAPAETPNFDTFASYAKVGYDQGLRPQFHFTSRMNWLNDPNGMVYYDGEWHMLFQHVAVANNTGIKSWGNAVSTDLMHWQQLPHAINPYPKVDGSDGMHAIWSGSAVVDVHNALGKQKGDTKTLFALYSATHDKFFQGGAYSTDKGRTWTKINDGKPIIPHQEGYSKGQRDPRIFYYEPGKFYVTIMMIGGPERAVRLWKSTNLLDWTPIGDIANKAAECIDMYPIGDKWVIADANTRYEIGDFDGKTWTGHGAEDADGNRLKFDYGDAYYAAQAFNQGPDGRVVHVGWLRSKQAGYRPFLEAGMPFTQQMSIPAEITIRGDRLYRNPVAEIAKLYAKTHRFSDLTAESANAEFASITPELIDLTLRFQPQGDLTFHLRGLPIHYKAAEQEFHFTNSARVAGEKAAWKKKGPYRDTGLRRIPAPSIDGAVTLRALVDRASLELFINGGQAAASFVVVPKADNRELRIQAASDTKIHSLIINELKSAWQ